MITSGQALGANTSVCLKSSFGSDTYYDVHEIRRTNAGLQQVAGLSLMRPVEGSVGWQVVTGSLADLSASGLQVDGLSGGAMPSCQEGLVSAFDTNFAEFFWRDYTPPFDPGFFNLGGPAYVRAAALQNPAGVHVDYRIVQGQFSNSAYPRFERFGFADSNTLSAWAGSAAPPPGQAVQILSPASGQLVDSGPPIVVALQNGDGVALEFDGQPTGNPIVNPADGWHTLVAYKTAAPQFRHTVRFRTRRISDAYEDDDTRETFRALFEGVPQQHNFSEPMDNDWVAFAVTSGTRSRVRLTGGVAAKAALTLYRQDEYPAGPITQVA